MSVASLTEPVVGRPRAMSRGMSSAQTVLDASKRMLDANIPLGMWSATAQKTSQALTLLDIREGKYSTNLFTRKQTFEEIPEHGIGEESVVGEEGETDGAGDRPRPPLRTASTMKTLPAGRLSEFGMAINRTATGTYPNGHKFPPKHTWTQSIEIGVLAFLHFLKAPFGFIVTIYGLNVIAWGAMIFSLLIGGAIRTMCTVARPYGSHHYVHDCDDLYSPRRIWIEIDSQILTALFCCTAFGLVPWRARDLFWLLKWRFTHDHIALRRLAAWHRGWFRLRGSENLDLLYQCCSHDLQYNLDALPMPTEKASCPPLTGIRAPPTLLWKMDFFVWGAAGNTLFQIVLCYYMWAENRFVRPSWATGLFVCLGCCSAVLTGSCNFWKVIGLSVLKVYHWKSQRRLRMLWPM